jgi:hypothetical protein
MPHSTIWEIITRRTYGSHGHLVHPCTVDRRILEKYLPDSISADEIIPKVQQKKKELAKRFNITRLPSDREPGFLGQAALFEVIRETRADFSYYYSSAHERGIKSWLDGFGLFDALLSFTYLRQYFGFNEVDIIKRIFELISPSKVIIKLDKIWMYRLFSNISILNPRITDSHLTREVMKKLIRVQDSWGLTRNRISQWTGCNRKEAEKIQQIIAAAGFIHQCRLVSKNTGIVRTISMSSSLSGKMNAEDSLCSSWQDDSNWFASITCSLKDDVEVDYFEFEAYIQNIDNYDPVVSTWKIPDYKNNSKGIKDIQQLFCNSDLTLPNNKGPLTNHDVLFIALLSSMPVEFFSHWKEDVLERLVKGCGIPHEDAKRGFRNVFRKHMVRQQYNFVLSGNRKHVLILFKDSQKRIIPFLGTILINLPQIVLRTNRSMTYGMMYIYYPQYLTDKVQDFVSTTIKETEVDAQVFDIKEYKHAETSNILSLIS